MGDVRVVTIASPSHFQDLMDGIWNYFVNKYKVDIEITCNGHSLSAHQIILEIMCPTLKMPLTAAAAAVVSNRESLDKDKGAERKVGEEKGHPVTLNLDHVVNNGEDVALLVEFIYRGRMVVPEDRLDTFHEAARVLGLNSLTSAIEDFRKRGQNANSVKKDNEEENHDGGGGGGDGGDGKRDPGEEDEDDDYDNDTEQTVRGRKRETIDSCDQMDGNRNGGGGAGDSGGGGASSRRKRKRTPVKISQMVCDSKDPSSEDDDRRGANGQGPQGPATRSCRLTRSLTQWRVRMKAKNSRDRLRKRKEPDMEWPKNSTHRPKLPKTEPIQRKADNQEESGDSDHGGEDGGGVEVTDEGGLSEVGAEEGEVESKEEKEPLENETDRRQVPKQPKVKQLGKHAGTIAVQRGAGDDREKPPPQPKVQRPKRGVKKAADPKITRSEYSKLWRRNRPPRKCPHCPYETRDKDNYNSHLAKHDPNAERFTCEVCSKKFRNKRGYVCHRRGHLDPELLHRCFLCTFYTPQKASLVQHLAVRHRVDKEGQPLSDNFQCRECDFRCITDTKLKVHVKKKHLVDKPFKCGECEYSTFRKGDYDKHVSIRHRHERPYMCEVCGFRSQTQSGYERHKRSHTGEKPYKCDICGQLYADQRKLKVHLQRHINDEKPFVCHLCGHASRRKDNLQIHLKRIHKTTLDGNGGAGSCELTPTSQKPHSSFKPTDRLPAVGLSPIQRLDGSLQHINESSAPSLAANMPVPTQYGMKKAESAVAPPNQSSGECTEQSKQLIDHEEDVSQSEDETQHVVVQPMVSQILASDQEQTLTFIVPESAIQHINFFQFPFK